MRKDYQKAARGSIYAIAVMIAGTCFSATPAQSATCFLPSGECSTGKIGAGPSGGESTPEYCVGYDITEKEYNAKYNNACWDCSDSCVKTSGGTFYKCKTVNNTTWYDKYNVCCTDGTKYDKDDGKCCAGGKCDHPCSGGKQWSPTLKQCVCPSNVETDGNGNCCASGQVLDENKNCTTPCTMNDCGSYPYTTDPGNSEKCNLGCNKGTRYKCKSGYTYSGGKCVEPPAPTPTPKCTDVAATENKLEEIHQYETISAKKTEDITSAELGCGKNPIYAKEGGIGKDSSSWDYHYQSGPGPIYRMDSTTGKWYVIFYGKCMENLRCGAVVGEGYTDYTSFDNSGKYYCCKQNVLQNNRSYSESEINSILNQSCKTKPSGSEKPAPFSPYYVCDKGTMDYNRQCHLGTYSYSCPSGYTLSGEKCINKKANCPTGYKASAKDATSYYCRKTEYTCPTNFDYTLSGDKCYCQKPGACLDYTLTSKKDENCYACATCPTDSSKYKCIENIKSGYQLVNGVCSKKPTENCSKYSVSPWVVNGPDNSVKCRAINSNYVPCGEQATCGGTQYVECKNSSQCGNGGGSTGNSCTASTYTASVTCSLSYSTDECCSAFGCSGKGCGTGYYNCVFDVPSCAFSSVSIHATDSTGQDKIVASAGAGQSTRVLNNYQIPGPHTPCEFFASSSSLGKVKGEAVSGQSYTWKCSYTKKKQ